MPIVYGDKISMIGEIEKQLDALINAT